MTTKERILGSAVGLFNRFGYVNVRLQYIADEANLSVGNLAYHFKTKEAIFEAIYYNLEKEQKILLTDLRVVPLFENINNHLKDTFRLHQKYSFFYSDTLEIIRSFPQIKKQYREYTKWYIAQIETLIAFNVSRGVFENSKINDQITTLAELYWMTIELWLYQSRIRGVDMILEKDFMNTVWRVFLPYLSEVGQTEFMQIGNMDFLK
jgi:AcrR family transcriptional regulator